MKKTLLICIGLTIIVSTILIKLYSASVVRFISEVPDEKDSLEATISQPFQTTLFIPDSDEEEEDLFATNEEEYLDTIIEGGDTLAVKVNPTYVDCIVAGDQRITKNKPIKFIVLENLEVKDKFIPANTLLYAMPDIKDDGIDLRISTFQTTRGLVILSLHSLKQDLEDVLSSSSDNLLLQDGDTVLFDY